MMDLDPKEHIQNVWSSSELLAQNNGATYKIFSLIFCGSTQAWYYNLEPDYVLNFYDLCAKIISHLDTKISVKMSITNLFIIT